MSVILIDDLKGYTRLLNGIQFFRIKEKEFIGRFTELSEEIAEQLFYLHCNNVKSWNHRYDKETPVEQTYTKQEFIRAIAYNKSIAGNYTTVEQVLKSLQFLEYQLEDHEIKLEYQEETALRWLRNLIAECEDYLLRKYTQYETAKWAL